ncbi:uncharacterized protein LOC119071011 [Bradysia coprophila]|uniref:uncharacterized protein LOC119071011 n=1 Tax=Bradysia coprophila TaxID=38358 RepID=UPI00187DB0AD|nr:uncharacterized protein LOC119071011 [Bradysia coprophila]
MSLIETSANDNWECRKIDFNKTNSISAIEKCIGFNDFVIKSFEYNSSVIPYSHNSVYYLSTDKEGWSCFSTTELFTLEEDTEFSSAIYLQSNVIEDMSEVEIEVVDLDSGTAISVVNASTTRDFEWKLYRMKLGKQITNAKISVRAFVTTSANLAIQYMHILNPKIDESLCDIDDQTTTETRTEEQTNNNQRRNNYRSRNIDRNEN